MRPSPDERFDRPIILLSSPRSGSTLLFEMLANAPGLVTTGKESHQLIEGVGDLFPGHRGWTSNRLTETDATPAVAAAVRDRFALAVRDRDGAEPGAPFRLMEKTPKNALRVPFLDALFPDALFVYLYRDPRPTVSSMIEAWRSPRFVTYPRLPGWSGLPWSLLLIEGWRDLIGRPVEEIAARQWAAATTTLVDDLSRLQPSRVVAVDYEDLIEAPNPVAGQLASALGLGWDRPLADELPLSRHTVSPPAPDKWLANKAAIDSVAPLLVDADRRARTFLGERRLRSSMARAAGD